MKKHTCEGCHIIVPMYGIFTYMYHRFRSHVGKYSIHGAYGMCNFQSLMATSEVDQHNQFVDQIVRK